MFLWTLQQEKDFFQSEKSPLFDILSKELGIKPEQAERIQERRYANLMTVSIFSF